MDFPVRDHNRKAWDRQVDSGNEWTVPASPEVIAAARRGEWQVVLTPTRPVPHDWFGEPMPGAAPTRRRTAGAGPGGGRRQRCGIRQFPETTRSGSPGG
jgi:hypothetical protein